VKISNHLKIIFYLIFSYCGPKIGEISVIFWKQSIHCKNPRKIPTMGRFLKIRQFLFEIVFFAAEVPNRFPQEVGLYPTPHYFTKKSSHRPFNKKNSPPNYRVKINSNCSIIQEEIHCFIIKRNLVKIYLNLNSIAIFKL
jgi:hypothetical protein